MKLTKLIPLCLSLLIAPVSFGQESSDEAVSQENTKELCSDGIDNDNDGSIDRRDKDCRALAKEKRKEFMSKVLEAGGFSSAKEFRAASKEDRRAAVLQVSGHDSWEAFIAEKKEKRKAKKAARKEKREARMAAILEAAGVESKEEFRELDVEQRRAAVLSVSGHATWEEYKAERKEKRKKRGPKGSRGGRKGKKRGGSEEGSN